jgi:hypothetical protein
MAVRQLLPGAALLVTLAWSVVMVLLDQAALAAAIVPALLQLAGTWLVVRGQARRSCGRRDEIDGLDSQKEYRS